MAHILSNNLRHLSNNVANRITRESICTALLELLQIKGFNEITVSELVRRAGVSRQSFYRNYKTKEDIVLEIENTISKNLIEKMKDPVYISDPRKWILVFFAVITENTAVITMIQKADLFEVFFTQVQLLFENQLNSGGSDLHYNIVGSMGAVNAIVLDWFKNGMKESEREMVDICLSFCQGLISLRKIEPPRNCGTASESVMR